MRILLIYPDVRVHVNYPVGLGIISSVLKNHDHETRILHFNEEIDSPLDLSVLERHIMDFEPELIAFSSTSNQFKYVKQMTDFIKRKKDVPVLVGGIHPTITPEKVLQFPSIDMICRGEGEFSIIELTEKMVRGEDYTNVANLGLRKNGSVQINPTRCLIDESTLDSLPFPDREGFNFGEILGKKNGWANIMASRGCLNNCTYCVNHFYHKLYEPTNRTIESLRYRKVSTVIREAREMLDAYPGIRLLNFDDDNIVLNKKWLEEFLDEYATKIGVPFACNVHPAKFNAKTADMLAKAGCVELKIGLESGSQRIRRDVLRRSGRDDSTIVNAFIAADRAGLRAWSFNMVGLPTETREEMHMTARINAKIRPYIIRCSIFFPYEGTDLYDYSKDHDLLVEERSEKISSVFEDTILNMSQLPREEILKFKTMFKWYVDSYSDIEAAPLFQALLSLFEKFPDEAWFSGKAKELFEHVDREVDALLRELKMEHYTSRRHLVLNFTKRLNFELP